MQYCPPDSIALGTLLHATHIPKLSLWMGPHPLWSCIKTHTVFIMCGLRTIIIYKMRKIECQSKMELKSGYKIDQCVGTPTIPIGLAGFIQSDTETLLWIIHALQIQGSFIRRGPQLFVKKSVMQLIDVVKQTLTSQRNSKMFADEFTHLI